MDNAEPHRTIDANDWDDAKDKLTSLGRYWVFRGQRNSEWKLPTSFDRQVRAPLAALHRRYPSVIPAGKSTEDRLASIFRNAITPYLTHIPRNQLEWLALMQHYGAPTRLLDFSFSPYMAAFFAFRGDRDNEKCAVWALHALEFARDAILRLFKDNPGLEEQYPLVSDPLHTNPESLPNLGEDEFFDKLVLGQQWKAVLPLWSHGLDERMRRQHGMFILPCDVSVPAWDNFMYIDEQFLNRNLIKVTIPNEYTLEATADLHHMGITEETMFPGLEGALRSFNTQLKMEYIDTHSAIMRKQTKARENNMPTH